MELVIGLLAFGVGVLLYLYLERLSDKWTDSDKKYKRILGWCLLSLLTIGLTLYLVTTRVKSCSAEHESNQTITNTF